MCKPGIRAIIFWRDEVAVLAANSAQPHAFRPDELPLRKRGAIDAVVKIGALAPSIHVVVADNIQLAKKLRSHPIRQRLRRNLIARDRHWPRRIFRTKDAEQSTQRLYSVCS